MLGSGPLVYQKIRDGDSISIHLMFYETNRGRLKAEMKILQKYDQIPTFLLRTASLHSKRVLLKSHGWIFPTPHFRHQSVLHIEFDEDPAIYIHH